MWLGHDGRIPFRYKGQHRDFRDPYFEAYREPGFGVGADMAEQARLKDLIGTVGR